MSDHVHPPSCGAMRGHGARWQSDEASLPSAAGEISHSTVPVSGTPNQVGGRMEGNKRCAQQDRVRKKTLFFFSVEILWDYF